MTKKNYRDFDYQVILVRKDKSEEVINRYKSFGWEVISTSQHKMYENILEVEFNRNHFIKNKDDLQFLQVNMENDLNSRGRLEKNKHSKSTMFGIIFGLISMLLITCSVLGYFYLPFSYNLVVCISFAIFGLLLAILLPIPITRIFKKEVSYFNEKKEKLNSSIEEYCKKAKKLLGVKNED